MSLNPTTSSRRHDLDWLRVLAILTVFVFHCGRFFDTDGWHVKNPVRHEAVQVWTTFLCSWLMPLIFVISGASTFYALRARAAARFIKDRAGRLLVPLIVGIFTHISLQVYLERVSSGKFQGSFFAFYPHYFDGLYGAGGNFAWMGLHLWYLEMLFVFSLLLLPLFLWLKGSSGSRLTARAGALLDRPWLIYLPSLGPAAMIAFLNPATFWGQRGFGGWPLPAYLFLFIYGFMIVAREPLEVRVERQRRTSLLLAVAVMLTALVLWKMGGPLTYGTPRYAVLHFLYAASSWCFILAFLGLARRNLGFTRPFLKYANEAVLPFYILHQTLILSIGYFVVRWAIPDLVKFAIIAASSFVLVVATYEYVIRRNNPLRFLFGMKLRTTARNELTSS
jgi:peptidoglycan/LPS O-acetylase OafA/YrhL